MKRILLLIAVLSISSSYSTAQAPNPSTPQFDVVDYHLRLEPDITNKSLVGRESIKFVARAANLTHVELNCGELTVDSVRESGVAQKFVRNQHKLVISLERPAKLNETRALEIEYHGTPRRGIRFFPDRLQLYTIFSTSQWMVCVDEPDDRATFVLNLILPAKLSAVGNGSPTPPSLLPNGKMEH
ncbi:MAG TPA: hypothetical protein VF251_01110, partial [Pyrinomonadaceae bacterium]